MIVTTSQYVTTKNLQRFCFIVGVRMHRNQTEHDVFTTSYDTITIHQIRPKILYALTFRLPPQVFIR